MSVFNIGIFNGPRYSSFPWEHGNRISMNAGKLNVIGFEYLNAGDKLVTDLASVIRQAPMLAPTLDTYKCDVHAFACRLRSIGNAQRNPWVYEDFFNLNENVDGSKTLPSIPLGLAISASGLKLGLLSEQLGIPTVDGEFKRLKDYLMEEYSWLWDPVTEVRELVYKRTLPGSSAVAYAHDLCLVPSTMPSGKSLENVDQTFTNVLEVNTPYCVVGVRPLYGNASSYGDICHFGFDYKHGYANYTETYVHHLFTLGDQQLKVAYPMSLVDFVYTHYPKALVSDAFWPENVNGLVRAMLLPFATVNAEDEDLKDVDLDHYKGINGVNVLDLVYKVYKKDAVSVLAEYDDYLRDQLLSYQSFGSLNGFVSLPTANTSRDFRLSSANYLMRPLGSVAWQLMAQMLVQFPNLPTNTGAINGVAYKDVLIPSYPFLAYWKVISDWYINTAISDPDEYFVDHVFDSAFVGTKSVPLDDSYTIFEDLTYIGTPAGNFPISTSNNKYYKASFYLLKRMFSLANRYWANDYFTSAFPSPQLGSAVGIPVNGTIVDLRNANALQKLRERLLYAGKRFRDVIYSLFGIHTSSAILAMSEVFGSWSQQVNVDSVLQTSQSTKDSPQANFAGVGLGYGSGGSQVSYTAEEPTVILFVASILPRASYFQGVSRKLLRGNVYDYAIPQLANVGEQEISNGELYIGGDYSSNPVFGWTRRNGDFMWTPDEVHGDFRSSLDFWHNARIFGSKPSLSEEFLTVQPAEDNLNRIFAVQSDAVNHFYCHFKFFNAHVVRSLPKHVHYEL